MMLCAYVCSCDYLQFFNISFLRCYGFSLIITPFSSFLSLSLSSSFFSFQGVWPDSALAVLDSLGAWMSANGESIIGASPLFPYQYGNYFVTAQEGAMYISVPATSPGVTDRNVAGNITYTFPFVRPELLANPLSGVTLLGYGDVGFSLNTTGLTVSVEAPPAAPISLRSYYSADNKDTAPCALRSGGTCSVYTEAGYKLVRAECDCLKSQTADTVPFSLLFNSDLMDNTLGNPNTRLPNYDNIDVECYTYLTAGAGRLSLDVYWNGKDLWPLADPASRSQAVASGYTFNSTIGYCLPLSNKRDEDTRALGQVFKLTF